MRLMTRLSLRQQLGEIRAVEHTDEIHHLALQRDSEAEDSQQVRKLETQLDRADVRLRDPHPFGERLLAQPALRPELPELGAKKLTCRGGVVRLSHHPLTNDRRGHILLQLVTR
jgi:hypothetical protein